MRRSLLSAFLVLLIMPLAGQGSRDSLRNGFTNAESWFLFEDYIEAEAIYQKLLKVQPDNNNLKYKIGVCLLNDPYRKDESIKYLLEASDNINMDYKEGSFKETTAPPDVMYYLGNAYLVNEKMDMAIEAFAGFLEIMDPDVYDEELVLAQIQACRNAKRLMSMPVDLDLYPVSQEINTRYADINPVISGDGNRMAFITIQPFFDEALYIENVDGNWTLPMSITSMLGFDEDIYPVAMNYDGTEMLLYYDDERIGNLYFSEYEDGFWGPAEKLGENISTKYWESHGCFSKDGQTLYFTSNRKGSHGGLDIYKSERQPNDNWGIPENLGPTINSRYNEETPFITEDGQTIYFSSYGHYNMGGYDIFFSTKNDDGSWGEPVNLGYPINSTGDDLFFHPVKNGYGGYQSRIEENSRGRQDLYYMDIYSVNNPRMYLVTGVVRTEDGDTNLTTLQMFVIDPESGDTLKYSIPIGNDGSFELNLTQGDYMLHFTGKGYEEMIRPLSITPSSSKEGLTLDDVIELALVKKVPRIFAGEESLIEVKDTVYQGVAGKPIIIPLKLEKGSTLITRIAQDSTLVSLDTMEVEKRRTDLEIIPLPGVNVIDLEMIDSDGNIHKKRITVIGIEPEIKEKPQPEKTETVLIPASLAGMPVGILLADLRENTEGDLQDYLLSLDLEKEGIETTRELFEHLYEQADKGTFEYKDVDQLLTEELLKDEQPETRKGGSVNVLHQLLLDNSTGPLKAYLSTLDLENEDIKTAVELLDHLEKVAEENGYSMDDVREAMLDGLETDPTALLLLELQQKSSGDLNEYLKELNLEEEGIHSPVGLFKHLYDQSENQGYSNEDVDVLLADELAKGDVNQLYQMLLDNSTGPLKDYLEGLDLEKEGITTSNELLNHLQEVSVENGFTMDDVREAMLDGLETDPTALLLLELQQKSSGDLNEYLKELDLEEEGIHSPVGLFKHLYDQSENQGYSNEDVDVLLADELAKGDVNQLYQMLLDNSTGPLKDYLEGLDLEKEGINTTEELLKHLNEVAEENGFTMDDVRKAMMKALEKTIEAERLYYQLLETTDGVILEILEGIDLGKEGIHSVEDLIISIYNALVERGLSKKEISQLLEPLFPGYEGFIKGLMKSGRPVFLWVAISGSLLLIILWFRRRKKE